MEYKLIDQSHADEIAELAVCLTNEIMHRTGEQLFDIDVPLAIKLCRDFVSNGLYDVMAAFDGEKIVGFGAICESHSLYAEGAFGIIQEFYVMPDFRSQHIGQHLINAIIALAKGKQWTRLELCTPPLPAFDQTVAFYQANGFTITGGYKMKYTIT